MVATGDRPSCPAPRLLICDDEPAFTRYVRAVARDMGFDVQIAANGRVGIEICKTFRPTTVVLDMIMPEMGGGDVVRWLIEDGSPMRLIVITGFSPEDPDALALLPASSFLEVVIIAKPVSLARLRQELAAAAGKPPPPSDPSPPLAAGP